MPVVGFVELYRHDKTSTYLGGTTVKEKWERVSPGYTDYLGTAYWRSFELYFEGRYTVPQSTIH